MRINTKRALMVGLSVVAAGLLSACSGELTATEDTSAPTTSTAPSTSVSESRPEPESPETSAADDGDGAGTGEGSGGGTGEGSGEGADEAGGVNCGPVDGLDGPVDLFAADTEVGTVGCVEAINVITTYFADAPTKGEGTAYTLTVDGWYCLMDTGVQGTGAVGCDKDGLAFHTLP